jgi:hypothetical protein
MQTEASGFRGKCPWLSSRGAVKEPPASLSEDGNHLSIRASQGQGFVRCSGGA